ncbi:MAG: TIGR04076 family protein [Peptostreptococcaceae bacterium]
MKKCKIEVLKTMLLEDLAQEYGCKGLGKCPFHNVGDVFYGDFAKPEGLCDEAWKAMYQYVFAISHGSEVFYYGDWIDKPGVAICSCNDGIRPVIFKITATTEESTK